MRNWLLRAIVVLLGACVALTVLMAVFFFLLGGVQARPPGRLETRILTFAKHQILVGSKGLKSPLLPTAENISEGQQSFSHYCFACHGLDGQKTGVPFADAMSPPVPSLASPGVQAYTDGQLYWIIGRGLWPSGMPAAKGILNEEEMWSIVLYIRHLPPAGSLGEPQSYSDDDGVSPKEQESSEKTSRKKPH
jgi:mono/diheme cytochrome c family protein